MNRDGQVPSLEEKGITRNGRICLGDWPPTGTFAAQAGFQTGSRRDRPDFSCGADVVDQDGVAQLEAGVFRSARVYVGRPEKENFFLFILD